MRSGETKQIEARFPEDYGNADLAGKTALFTVTVQDNKTRELPELDDELAKRFLGPEATLGTLRDDIRNRLEASARTRQRRAISGPIMDQLIAAHEFPVPEVLVERNAQSLFEEAKQYVARAKLEWDAYLSEQGKSEEELRAEYRIEAERRVRSTFLLEAIAKAEGIRATAEDVEAEVRQLSRDYGQPRDAILRMLGHNYGTLIDGIIRTKTMEFLADNAVVTVREPQSVQTGAAS
jgi:trigger factor